MALHTRSSFLTLLYVQVYGREGVFTLATTPVPMKIQLRRVMLQLFYTLAQK